MIKNLSDKVFVTLFCILLIGSLIGVLYEFKQKSSCILNVPREITDSFVFTDGLFTSETTYHFQYVGTREDGETCKIRRQVSIDEYNKYKGIK